MTPEETTALAREYAEEYAKGTPIERLPNELKEHVIQQNTNHLEKFLRQVLRRYYLVEKSKLKDVYQRTKNTEKDGEDLKLPLLRRTGRIQRILLESLFPEIGKEVEK